MRFNLRRKPVDRPDHANGTEDHGVDLDRWVEFGAEAHSAASDGLSEQLSATDVDSAGDSTTGGDQSPLSLRDKLLAVLAEDDASLVPPSAGDMTQAEWDSLTEIEREGYRRKQLEKLDPRLVPRYTMGTSLSGSRSARVYR
ncbi:MAG: hypothetical protein ACR2QO_15020 [Acidimicrobiales bacterium]